MIVLYYKPCYILVRYVNSDTHSLLLQVIMFVIEGYSYEVTDKPENKGQRNVT
jgi:hypothetical protein